MAYHADPGGVFASDTHRRVLGHLPVPAEKPILAVADENDYTRVKDLRRDSLFHRMQPDVGTDLADADELAEVLADLEADGYATELKDGWKMTKSGFDALTAGGE